MSSIANSRDNYNDEDSDALSNYDEELPEKLSEADRDLLIAVERNDAAAVQQALRNGANANCVCNDDYKTPLAKACREGYDNIVRILLNAGADVRWKNSNDDWSAVENAISTGQLSTIELLLNHDNDLLEIANEFGGTPLLAAISFRQFEIAHFLLARGANALATNEDGSTTLILVCQRGAYLEIVRQLLAAGVNVEVCDMEDRTALHYAAKRCHTSIVHELIVEQNANMFAVDGNEETPFDFATRSDSDGERCEFLIECYGNKLTQEHGRLALHAILAAAEYSFIEDDEFHPPLNPIRIHLPLGELTLQHFRALLSTLDTELIRNRDESGKLPIHIACRNKAPVEVLALIAEQDVATLHLADFTGALPLHECCCGFVDDSNVQFLVEKGGDGTLTARNRDGALPLHVLCGSKNPPLRTIQYMIQSFPGSVAAQTNSGQYSFMIAACASSTAFLSAVYELVRASPNLIFPHT